MVVFKTRNTNSMYHCLVFKNRTSTVETLQGARDYLASAAPLYRNQALVAKDVSVSSRIAYEYGYDEIAMMSHPLTIYEREKPRTFINNLSPSTYYPKLIKPENKLLLETSTSHRLIIIKAKTLQHYKQFELLSKNSFIFENVDFNFFTLGFIIRATSVTD